MDAFFGYEDWFEVKPKGSNDDAAAEAMQKVLRQILKTSNFRGAFEELVMNVCIYGHGGLKVDWDWGYDLVNKKTAIPKMGPDSQPIIDPATNTPIVERIEAATVPVPRMRPRFTAIDIYDLLIDPDGGMKAEIVERTFGQLQREAQMNPELYFPGALAKIEAGIAKAKDPNNVIIRMVELWDELNDTVTIATIRDDWRAVEYKDKRASYRASTYSTYRREVYGGPAIILWEGSIQFNHKRTAILDTAMIKLPNEVYGIGVIEPISEMIESMSKFMNMIVDNWNMGINKRFIFDIE